MTFPRLLVPYVLVLVVLLTCSAAISPAAQPLNRESLRKMSPQQRREALRAMVPRQREQLRSRTEGQGVRRPGQAPGGFRRENVPRADAGWKMTTGTQVMARSGNRVSRDPQVQELLEALTPEQRRQTVEWFQNLTEQERRDLRETLVPLGKEQRKVQLLNLVRSGSRPQGIDDLRRQMGLPARTPVAPLRIEARNTKSGVYSSSGVRDARVHLPAPGALAPPFELEKVGGGTVSSKALRGKALVVELGSITCPTYRKKREAMGRLKHRYGDVAEFVMIYTVEAHPHGRVSPYSNKEWIPRENERDGLLKPQPGNLEERRLLAREVVEKLGEILQVGIDAMDNGTWRSYGARANAAFVIGPDGRILLSQEWADPDALDQFLAGRTP